MRRRLILQSVGFLLAMPAFAQTRQARVGVALAEQVPTYLAAFTERLAQLGWQEGANLVFLVADARGDPANLPSVVRRLVDSGPDVILSSSNRTHRALQAETSSIPVVVVAASDPLRIGLSDNLARPTRNFTGTIGFVEELMAKRVEFVTESMPNARRVALLLDPSNPSFPSTRDGAATAAERMGLSIVIAGYRNAAEVLPALEKAGKDGCDLVIVIPDPLALNQLDAIARRAEDMRLPTMGFSEMDVRRGLTFALGGDRLSSWRDSAVMVDRLLRGVRVADIPFERPTRTLVSINLGAARRLGLTLSNTVLARADEVIE
jgi:putative ABC transport system substrate-binding protein